MNEHGITNTKAVYWIHLHPLEPAIYRYSVSDARAYIFQVSPRLITARSRNGLPTGEGYLFQKNLSWIQRKQLEQYWVAGVDWRNLTNRESGMDHGPRIVCQLITAGVFPDLQGEIEQLDSFEAQIKSTDISVGGVLCEIKTECVETLNLFVQRGEDKHHPMLLPDGTVKKTPASLPFDTDPAIQHGKRISAHLWPGRN